MTAPLDVTQISRNELAAYLERVGRGHVDQMVELGGMDRVDAEALGAQQLAELASDGRLADGHTVLVADDASTGERVGAIWLALRPQPSGVTAFVYDVTVEDSRRGNGHGRALMCHAEGWARRHGAERLGLQVFGDNEVARGLYASLGYAETAVVMTKRLDSVASS